MLLLSICGGARWCVRLFVSSPREASSWLLFLFSLEAGRVRKNCLELLLLCFTGRMCGVASVAGRMGCV